MPCAASCVICRAFPRTGSNPASFYSALPAPAGSLLGKADGAAGQAKVAAMQGSGVLTPSSDARPNFAWQPKSRSEMDWQPQGADVNADPDVFDELFNKWSADEEQERQVRP